VGKQGVGKHTFFLESVCIVCKAVVSKKRTLDSGKVRILELVHACGRKITHGSVLRCPVPLSLNISLPTCLANARGVRLVVPAHVVW